MHVELATCPASWGVFWADGTPSGVSADTFLDGAAAAGYVGIELGPVGYLPTEKQALEQALAHRGLSARAGTACYTFDELPGFEALRPRAEALCGLLQTLSVPYLVMMDESPYAKDPAQKAAAGRARRLKNFGLVKDYVAFAKRYGVTVVYHPHVHSIVETEEEILELMDVADCMLCLDTGHHQLVNGRAAFGDRTATDFYLAHHRRIPFLHFKNVSAEGMRRRAARPAEDTEAFCPLDEGVIDFAQFREALEQTNYQGVGVVEQDCATAAAEESLALAMRNREYLYKTGIVTQNGK